MIDKLTTILPGIEFIPGERFAWSPKHHQITYPPAQLSEEGAWALLHEAGHAISGHLTYQSDYELLRMEIDAWEKAKDIALKLNIDIKEEHIQDCLDSYRDWLYRRSICPECGTKTIQKDNASAYSCFNCHACWQVSPSRFCRAYRTLIPEKENLII